MSTISPAQINDGDAVTAASVNSPINTIANDYNGNITASNLASNAVTTAKITNATVTADKLATGASSALVATSQTTTSTSYADLATTGPAVTVIIGANGLALISIYAGINNSGANFTGMSFAISGASTQAAADNFSIVYNGTLVIRESGVFLLTGLTPGSTTFTAKYIVNAGTGTFQDRRIAVIPL